MNQSDFNEFSKQLTAFATKKAPTIDEIYKACNASLTCAIECPNPKHTPEDCQSCGNEECVNAYQELETIWQQTS